MKPETEKLLHQCRAALLQYSNEQLNTLFVSWFERMVGEELMDEALDDLCLLLDYGIRSSHSNFLYATYTAWWEVEGYADLDGEFVCLDMAALQHHLITMPIKQFNLVTELAYQVCVLDAETEGQPCPPTGQEWLRVLAHWLDTGAREPFHRQIRHKEALSTPPLRQQPLTHKQRGTQQPRIEEAALETSRVDYLARQRELEDARKPAWIKAIVRLSAQGQEATYSDLAETIVLPEEWATLLSKEQLGAFLAFLNLPASSREMKANLVQHLLARLEVDKTAKAQFFEAFAFELAVPPWELETLLGCTTTERKRWTEEKKLPVLGYGSFRKVGSDHAYAVYDRRVILTLMHSEIELWRSEHQALVHERRKAAAQVAAAGRKAKRQEAKFVAT